LNINHHYYRVRRGHTTVPVRMMTGSSILIDSMTGFCQLNQSRSFSNHQAPSGLSRGQCQLSNKKKWERRCCLSSFSVVLVGGVADICDISFGHLGGWGAGKGLGPPQSRFQGFLAPGGLFMGHLQYDPQHFPPLWPRWHSK
jgi:hypothetical protein